MQAAASIEAWNLMGGRIDGSLLELVIDMLGIDDVELLMRNLVSIRERGASA